MVAEGVTMDEGSDSNATIRDLSHSLSRGALLLDLRVRICLANLRLPTEKTDRTHLTMPVAAVVLHVARPTPAAAVLSPRLADVIASDMLIASTLPAGLLFDIAVPAACALFGGGITGKSSGT